MDFDKIFSKKLSWFIIAWMVLGALYELYDLAGLTRNPFELNPFFIFNIFISAFYLILYSAILYFFYRRNKNYIVKSLELLVLNPLLFIPIYVFLDNAHKSKILPLIISLILQPFIYSPIIIFLKRIGTTDFGFIFKFEADEEYGKRWLYFITILPLTVFILVFIYSLVILLRPTPKTSISRHNNEEVKVIAK